MQVKKIYYIITLLIAVFTIPAPAYAGYVDKRMDTEKKHIFNRYLITPRKPNYILPVTYRRTMNAAPYDLEDGEELNNVEIKFQISLKFLLFEEIANTNTNLFAAYTAVSYWQAYNNSSAPFRETNYEPEVYFSTENDWEIFGFKNIVNNIGFVHQSNGRGRNLSRSWNRLFGEFVFEKGKCVVAIKPWWRLPEKEENDDNPDIDKYLGYGELYVLYKINDKYTLGSMFRNNLRADNKGAIELNLSFPLTKRLSGYVQYFYGYGDSLIDYNVRSNRIGIGIIISNWI